jgi:hypothetical protein
MATEIIQIKIDDIDEETLLRSQQSASFYGEKWLGLRPYYYQIPFLDDPNRFKAATFSRQLGKTFCIALKASQVINMYPDSEVGITAQNERRAFEIYRMVKWMQGLNPIIKSLLQPKNDKMHEMLLDTGSRVTYYASGTEGKSIRGATLDLLLMDEADFIPDLVFTATLPTISATGGGIMLTSTPNRPFSMFHEIFMDGWNARLKFEGKMDLLPNEEPYSTPIGRKYGFSAYHYDWEHGTKVINPKTGLPQIDEQVVRILEAKDYYVYEREYLAWWPEEGSSFFPLKTITGATVGNETRATPPVSHVMGLDLGRINDYTAIVIYQVNEHRDAAVIVDSYKIRKNNWKTIFGKILKYARKWSVVEIILDGNNVGDIMSTWLASVSGEGATFNVVPVPLSIQSKARLYNNLKMGINTGRVQICMKNEDLITELIQIQGEETDTGKIKIHAPTGKHDDLADAAALGAKILAFPDIMGGDMTAGIIPHTDFFRELAVSPDEDVSDIIGESDFKIDDWDLKPQYEY